MYCSLCAMYFLSTLYEVVFHDLNCYEFKFNISF